MPSITTNYTRRGPIGKLLIFLSITTVASATPPNFNHGTSDALVTRQPATALTTVIDPKKREATIANANEPSGIARSLVLHDGINWTLVPKGAVIFLPTPLKNRVDVKPLGTLLSWSEFFTKNRSWITTNEVPIHQASGSIPLPAERVAFWSMQDKLVVATHQTAPISVKISTSNSSAVKN